MVSPSERHVTAVCADIARFALFILTSDSNCSIRFINLPPFQYSVSTPEAPCSFIKQGKNMRIRRAFVKHLFDLHHPIFYCMVRCFVMATCLVPPSGSTSIKISTTPYLGVVSATLHKGPSVATSESNKTDSVDKSPCVCFPRLVKTSTLFVHIQKVLHDILAPCWPP
jgi:hypothetical protein